MIRVGLIVEEKFDELATKEKLSKETCLEIEHIINSILTGIDLLKKQEFHLLGRINKLELHFQFYDDQEKLKNKQERISPLENLLAVVKEQKKSLESLKSVLIALNAKIPILTEHQLNDLRSLEKFTKNKIKITSFYRICSWLNKSPLNISSYINRLSQVNFLSKDPTWYAMQFSGIILLLLLLATVPLVFFGWPAFVAIIGVTLLIGIPGYALNYIGNKDYLNSTVIDIDEEILRESVFDEYQNILKKVSSEKQEDENNYSSKLFSRSPIEELPPPTAPFVMTPTPE